MMRAATLLPALALVGLITQAALAQESKPSAPVLRLSPGATQQLLQQQKDGQPLAKYRQNEIRDFGRGAGAGVSYHENDVFVGTFKRSVSPYNDRVRPWVLDRGIYAKRSGERYVGRFHFFHNDWGEHSSSMEKSAAPVDGVYFLVGSLIPTEGPPRPGIYRSDVQVGGVYHFVPADQGYLAQFEQRYRGQVNVFKQAQARKDSGGLSFGQLLALGLGVAAVGAADIPAADAVEIGGAFAADVLTKGETNALGGVVETKRNQAAVSGGNAPVAPAGSGGYRNETVTLSCPSGVASSVPLQFRTQACRNAMVAYWKAYACNQIGDIASATQQCKSACGNAQCRE